MNVERILIRAKAHIKKGQLNEARILYALILEKFPQNQNAQNELKKLPQSVTSKNTSELTQRQIDTVIALYHAGQTDQALETLKKLTNLFPTAAILFNIEGVCYANQQQFDIAISSYKQAIKIQPDYTEVHYNLGVAFNNAGTPNQAISSYKRALEINPDYPEAHYNLGVIYSSQRKFSTAIFHYRQAIKFKPNYIKACSNLGIALKDTGQLQASAESYRQVLKLQPDNPEALYNLANVLYDLGQIPAAIGYYNNALEINPDYAEAHNNIGIALKESGKTEQASNHYKNALKKNPNYAEAHFNLGIILQDTGQLHEAKNHYEQALKINPDYAEAHNNLGNTLHDLNQPDQAIDSYKKAIQIKPNYAQAHNNLGVSLNATHHSSLAINSYTKSLKLDPDYHDAHYNLGNAYKDAGQLNDAISCFQQVLKIKPNHAQALIHLSIYAWLDNNLSRLSDYLALPLENDQDEHQKTTFIEPYKLLLNNLLRYRLQHPRDYSSTAQLPVLYVIGESHCLPAANTIVSLDGETYRIQSQIIIGCKMWHLANNQENGYKKQLKTALTSLPEKAKIILIFGEIDCRLDDGIIRVHHKTNNDLIHSIQTLISNYLDYLVAILNRPAESIIISAIPPLSINRKKRLSKNDKQLLSTVIHEFNQFLKESTKNHGLKFMTLQETTQSIYTSDPEANFIDGLHLTPATFIKAVSHYQ